MKLHLLPRFAAILIATLGACGELAAATKATKQGTLLTEHLTSKILKENLVGLDLNRTIKIYLPPGYAESGKSYPVVYFCHNINWSPEQMFEDGNLQRLIEQGFVSGVVQEFIFVAASYATPTMGSLYENSPVSGRWLDYTVDEVVPFIDANFRTIRHRDSRGLVGDFMGGRGALKLAMVHAELFGSVYALHPVATGTGALPYPFLEIDWKNVHQAKSYADLKTSGRERIFVMISQAFLPNPNRPPFFCDFFMDLDQGELKYIPANTRKLQAGFHLDETLDECAANLRTMRGVAFDWARHDTTQAHVDSNQAFTRKLMDLGIEHQAEEYTGTPWNKNWTEDGRFATRVLPFFARHLAFQSDN